MGCGDNRVSFTSGDNRFSHIGGDNRYQISFSATRVLAVTTATCGDNRFAM
jgi:hypothetical protein